MAEDVALEVVEVAGVVEVEEEADDSNIFFTSSPFTYKFFYLKRKPNFSTLRYHGHYLTNFINIYLWKTASLM